jgi:hypothetical protein
MGGGILFDNTSIMDTLLSHGCATISDTPPHDPNLRSGSLINSCDNKDLICGESCASGGNSTGLRRILSYKISVLVE